MRKFEWILAIALVIVAIGGLRSGDMWLPTIMLCIAVALIVRSRDDSTNEGDLTK